MRKLAVTPSQTVGPFFTIGLTWEDGSEVVPDGTPGAIWIRGVVYDGAGEPVSDGMIETWQADADGRFPSEHDPRGASRPTAFAVSGARAPTTPVATRSTRSSRGRCPLRTAGSRRRTST